MARLINRQASRDDLTGLPNRRAMLSAAGARLAGADARHALLLLDLDRFKEVNDALGHQAGDALLAQVARRLEGRLRSGDLLARLGGDEFGVLLRNAGRTEAEAVAHDLVAQLLEPFRVDDLKIHTDVSVGVALYPDHGDDFSTCSAGPTPRCTWPSRTGRCTCTATPGGRAGRPLRPRRGVPCRPRHRPAGAALPAEGEPRHGLTRRRRGPRALAAPDPRAAVPRRVPAPGRGGRPDARADRRGAAHGARPGRDLAVAGRGSPSR